MAPKLGPNFGKIDGASHPDSIISRVATERERERCIAICEAWIGAWQQENPKHISPQQWAMSGIEDIIDTIREGKPYPDTGSMT